MLSREVTGCAGIRRAGVRDTAVGVFKVVDVVGAETVKICRSRKAWWCGDGGVRGGKKNC